MNKKLGLYFKTIIEEIHFLFEEGNGTPLQYSCLENPMDGGAWWAAVDHFHFSLSCIGEGNGNPLQCSCLENPRGGGAWWAAIYGVGQSWTRLKRLSSSSSSSGPRLGLEPRRRESSKVGMGALIYHSFFLIPSDRISASSPRVVGDARARALCADMKRCSYYETCATYGLNVDRVFQEGELGHPLHVLGGRGT